MKKQIMLSLILVSLASTANAAEEKTFKSRADVAADLRNIENERIQREADQLAAIQELTEQAKISNATNAEISAKLDKLIESSNKHNVLMKTLLDRTQ